ncbi:MAG: hypothetical protein EOP00_24250 [Pedobacter sp.]|nr:MAG: hypothetical protein EOP00_24250 [Pedobacter sp.]
MQNSLNIGERVYLTFLMCLSWFAILFQFYLHINIGVATKQELFIRFFSYFTIDSNLLIALASLTLVCFRETKVGKFFNHVSVKTALTVYILVVGLIYNAVLRSLLVLEGWSLVLNELLHVVVPLMFLIYWVYFVRNKGNLKWSNVWLWLFYPLIYCIFVLLRGSYSDFYPYPFLNVSKLGMLQVLLNCVMVTVVFACLSALFVAIGKRKR